MILLIIQALLFGGKIQTVTLQTPEGARQPQIAVRDMDYVDSNGPQIAGHVFVTFGTSTAVHVSISPDSGASFGLSRKVADVTSLSLGMRRGPRIAVAGNSVVITAIAGKHGGGSDGDVLSWHSEDRGVTWTSDGLVNEVAGAAREGLHAMASGPKDEIFCAWIDLAEGKPRICGAGRTGERGGRWSSTRIVFADSDGICPCCHPSATFDAKGRLYVMWRGQDHGSRDMVVATSDDLGISFSKPNKLGMGTWKLEACPMDGGAIAAGGGRLRSVWRRDSSIFLADLAGPESKIGSGEQPSLVVGRHGEYVAWLERRGGALMLRLPRVADPIRLDEHANDPTLACGVLYRTPVLAAWESGTGDASKIVVARIEGAPAPTSK